MELNDLSIRVPDRVLLERFVLARLEEEPRTMYWLFCRAVKGEVLKDDVGYSNANERRMDRCLQRLRKAGRVRFDRKLSAWVKA